jgi:hypothetical protein
MPASGSQRTLQLTLSPWVGIQWDLNVIQHINSCCTLFVARHLALTAAFSHFVLCDNRLSSTGNGKTGGNNIALGAASGINLTTGSYNIDIGNHGFRGEANTIRIGTAETHTNTYIAGISGATVPTGVAVIVDRTSHLGTTTSSYCWPTESECTAGTEQIRSANGPDQSLTIANSLA